MSCKPKCGDINLIEILIQLKHTFTVLEKNFLVFLVIKILFQAKKMVIKLNKKNPIIRDLYTKKFKPKIIKPKKGKGSFKREKKNN